MTAKRKKIIEGDSRSSSSSSSWSNLDNDVIYSVMNRLHYSDQIRFRAVCKNWREATENTEEGIIKYKSADKLPWMMAIDRYSACCHLFDPHHKRKHTIKTSKTGIFTTSGASVLASKHGWVLLGNRVDTPYNFYGEMFFYNPFSEKIIHLRRLDNSSYAEEATFTKSPVHSECEVFVVNVNVYTNKITISACTRTNNECWSWYRVLFDREDFGACFAVEYMDGILYATSGNRTSVRTSVGTFNVANKEWKTIPCPNPDEDDKKDHFCHITERLIQGGDGSLYLAQCGIDLHQWRIYRLDKEEEKWIKVKSIGDNVSVFMECTPLLVSFSEKASGLTNLVHSWCCYRLPSRYMSSCPKILEIYNWDLIEDDEEILEKFPKIWLLPPQP